MLAGATASIGTPPSSHPRAFGRTSNVWQYLDGFQGRSTPPIALDRSRRSGRERGDPRNSQLDPVGDDLSDGSDDEDDESEASRSASGHSRSGSAGPRRRLELGERKSRHSSTTSTRHSVKFASGGDKRASAARHLSGGGLKNVVSLPELMAGGHAAIKKPSLQPVGNNTNSSGSSYTMTETAPGSPIWRRDRKTPTFKAKVNISEVMRTLNALGTSASEPALVAPALSQPTSPQQLVQTLQAGGNSSPMLPSAAGLSGTTQPAVAMPTVAAVVSDAEKLRNDFNSQRTRLSYGCSVALELFNGHVLMVGSPDGQVRVQSLEKLQALPAVKGYKDRAVLTLLDMADPRSASSIRFGDAVWLQLSVGTGETSWEQGGVLGAKVREAPQLKALALSDGPDLFRDDVPAPAIVGHPVPIRAYLPKSRDDGDMQMDEIQSRVRNKASKMLGKWVVRSAVHSSRKQPDDFVYNNDEIYLEQDWFYLGADSDAGIAVLRQLPSALSSASATTNDVKDGEYVVERRAAWRVRLLDSSNGGAGLSLAQQQMERLLLRAKTQLKQSRKMRAGQTRAYPPGIHGGAGFPRQLRAHVGASIEQCDAKYLSKQQRRLETLGRHLSDKAQAMDVGVQLRDPRVRAKSRQSSCVEYADDGAVETRASTLESSDQSTRRGSARRRSIKEASGAVEATGRGKTGAEGGCALCQSSTLGINLCCQLHHVMRELQDEAKARQRRGSSSQDDDEGECDDHASVAGSSCGSSTGDGDSGAPVKPSMDPMVVNNDPLVVDPHQDERIRRLLAMEDAVMVGMIRFKEKEEQEVLAAEEQARIGLSPVAAQLRDRFKHVGLLAQAHHQDTHAPQAGIGGHFQRLHAELDAEAAETRKRQGAGKELALDTATCPLEYPPEGYDVYGDKVDSDAEEGEAEVATHARLFPTPDELDLLPPIDTKKVLALYSHTWSAVLEMLEGFEQLVETHVVPGLHSALAERSRGALVELLDFAARAAEFVCAERVQVRVAQLLTAISASGAGDFEGFAPALEQLLDELDATVAFAKFFRERNAKARRKKG